jgi:hypothetical protein
MKRNKREGQVGSPFDAPWGSQMIKPHSMNVRVSNDPIMIVQQNEQKATTCTMITLQQNWINCKRL